jgi:hypothetical protein
LVVGGVLLQVANLDTAAHLGVDSGTKDGNSNWNLLVAWKSSGDDKLADLELSIHDRAAVALHLWSTADKWEARGARFAADFALQAAETYLSGAASAVTILLSYEETRRFTMRTPCNDDDNDGKSEELNGATPHVPCRYRSSRSRERSKGQCFPRQQRRHPCLFSLNAFEG